MDDRYGLRAIYSFQVAGDAMSNMASVRDQLRGIIDAVRNLSETSSVATPRMGRDFGQMGTKMARGTEQASNSLNSFATAAKAARDAFGGLRQRLQPLKSEFRALRAESRNIDFGDLTDSSQFQQASRDIEDYITSLKALERQVQGNSFAEREFGASLKQQQRIAQTRVDMAGEQRKAAIASQRLGVSQGLQSTGQAILGTLDAPIQSAQELQQSLGNVKKLADDLSSEGYRDLTNSALNFSAAIGVADTEITAIYEDLAGAGKGFGKELQDRIGETEGILQVKSALDVSIGAATQLDITLGSIYKHSLTDYAGGVVELNQRTASSINELADNLQNVRISAEDVIPVMKVVMNVAGDAKNFPVSDIAAYGAAISALGTVEPEAAGSFFNRLGTSMAGKFKGAFIEQLGYGDEATFGQAVDTDKLGVLLKILEKYKNLEGGELVKGSFLSGIGIKSAQDQKLVQGLANNLDVLIEARKVAAAGFQGQEGQDLSVQAEFNRTMQTGAFQARRFQAAVTALKDTLGLAIQDALTPFMVNLSDIIGVVLKFTQKYPGLTRAIALGTFGFGALATAVGTAGIVLFGFQQASATASVAMLSMRSSLLPLTGFFETGLAGMTGGTNALTISLGLLGKAGSVAVAPFTVLGSVLSFLTSPFVLAIASLTSLYILLESLNPHVNLLGRAFSLIAAPIGFIKGLLSGFISGILPAIAPLGNQIKRSLVRPLSVVSEAVQQAASTFAEFSAKGEQFGNQLAQGLIAGFTRIGAIWDYTINWIKSRIAPLLSFFRSVGQMFVSALAENSPGPTFQIRAKWDITIEYIKEKVASLRVGIANIGRQIADSFSRLALSIQENFSTFLTYGIRGAIRAAIRVIYSEFSLSGAESISLVSGFLGLIKGEFLQFVDAIASISLTRGIVNLFEPLRSGFSLMGAAIGVQVQTVLMNGRIFQTALGGIATAASYVARNLPILASGINYVTLAFRALTPALRRIVPGLGIILFLIDTIHLLYRGLTFLDTKLGWTWLDGLVGGLKTASDAIDAVTSKIQGFIVSGVTALISAISTNWSQGFVSITESWQSWVTRITVGIAAAKDAIASIPSNLSTTFDAFLTDSQAALASFTANVQSWFRSLGSTLVHFVPNTIRGVFERLNLANFILLFTSSLPLGLLSGQIKAIFIAAAARALPGIAAALGLAAFGPLVEAIALALPVIASLLVSSGVADKVTNFFSNVFTQAVSYAVNELGLELPDWLKTVGAFTGALDHFFRQLGQLALSIPTPAFFTLLSPFILAVISRFNQATKAFELFVEKAGGVKGVILLMGQGLRKLVAPLGLVAKTIADILTGPPPDLSFLIRPLVAAFNYIKPLLQPIISTVATVLRPLLLSLGTALQPLIATITSVASQVYSVLLPAITAIRTNLLGVIASVLESPAFTALLPFLNLVGGGAIAAGLGVARAATGGAAAVAGGVKSTIDIAAPRLVQAGDFSVRILGNILKAVLLIAKELTGAAIAPLNILQEILDFTNVERVTQAAGRVTPIDLLPFFEDVRLGKIQKQSGVLVNSLGPLGKTLVQLRFSFVAILEVAGSLGLGLVALEGYLKATGSSFSIFGTAAAIAAQALNVAKVAISALRLAWVSLRYVTLDLTNNLIPPKLAKATPQWVKNTSAVLKVLRDAFLLTARVVTGALYGIAIALKAVYSAVVLLGVIPALQVLKFGLILVKSVLEIVTGDFHSLAKGAEVVKGALLGVVGVVYNLRDVLIPVALIFGTLLFPRIGLVVTVAVELVRGFKDVRNIFNLTYQAIKFVVGGLYELRGAIALVSFALFAVFNLSSPWLMALTAGIGWVIEWTRGFRELHQIIDALSGAIAFLDKSIKGLIDSVFAPISFGPFQGMIDFIKNNWPIIVGAFVAFNIFLTRNLFGGFQKSFGVLPRLIGIINQSFSKLVGTLSQILPFFSKFRRELTSMELEHFGEQVDLLKRSQFGGGRAVTIADRERLGRGAEAVDFRRLIEQEALNVARRNYTERKLKKTYSFRTDEGYVQRLQHPRSGVLDPRRIGDTLEARTVQFSNSQLERARASVVGDYKILQALAKKAGLGGMSAPQLQYLTTREGAETYSRQGEVPEINAKQVVIYAGEVMTSDPAGMRQGKNSNQQANRRAAMGGAEWQRVERMMKNPAVQGMVSDKVYDFVTIDAERINKGLTALTSTQKTDTARILRDLKGVKDIDALRQTSALMNDPSVQGRRVPQELADLERAVLKLQIRRQVVSGTDENAYDLYHPQSYAQISRKMQDPKKFRQLMEGQGYDEEFIVKALETAQRSQKPTRNKQLEQLYQRQQQDLIATLMATELSLGSSSQASEAEKFYKSPLRKRPRDPSAPAESEAVARRGFVQRLVERPTYQAPVQELIAQQESKSLARSIARRGISRYGRDSGRIDDDMFSIAKATTDARKAMLAFLDRADDAAESQRVMSLNVQDFNQEFVREVRKKGRSKEFVGFMRDVRALEFLQQEAIAPTRRPMAGGNTGAMETIPIKDAIKDNQQLINMLGSGNIRGAIDQKNFGVIGAGAIARAASNAVDMKSQPSVVDTEQLYHGQKFSEDQVNKAVRLRSQRLQKMVQEAGYADINELIKESEGRFKPAQFTRLTRFDLGDASTTQALTKFSRQIGVDVNDLAHEILTKTLLDAEKATPKGLVQRARNVFSLRNRGVAGRFIQEREMLAERARIGRQQRREGGDRVSGLNAMLADTGGNLDDLLKTVGTDVSAKQFRQQVRDDPRQLARLLGTGKEGGERLSRIEKAFGVEAGKLADALDDAIPITAIDKLEVSVYTALSEFGQKTQGLFQRIGKNFISIADSFSDLLGIEKLSGFYSGLRTKYEGALQKYGQSNAYNLNAMIRKAGFDSTREFVDSLVMAGIDKKSIDNLLKGQITKIQEGTLGRVASILGQTRVTGSGKTAQVTGDTQYLKNPNFSVKGSSNFKSFVQFAIEETFKLSNIAPGLRGVSSVVKTGATRAAAASGQLLTRIGQIHVRESINAIASSIESAAARFSMRIATGGGEPVTIMERLGKEVRRQIAVNLNKLALLATSPLKRIAVTAPNSKIADIVNAAYRSIPTRLLAIAMTTRESAEQMVNRGVAYQKELARADFFEGLAGKLENFQNNYPTVRTAIAGMFSSMGAGFQQLGSAINAKALDVAKKIGFDDLYVKFKQAIKQIPGFSDVDRAARIATIQGLLKQVRKGANAAAQSAEQRRIQFAAPRAMGQAGYTVTDSAGQRNAKREAILNRPDSKVSQAAIERMRSQGYAVDREFTQQRDPETIYGPFVKAFRTIAKAARVSESLVEKALSNPVVYVLTRWTDLTWFFLKKLPGAITSGMNTAAKAVASTTRRMAEEMREGFIHVVSRIIMVFPKSAGIIIGSLDLISRASRFVGNEIRQFLTSPTNWIASRWASTVNFLTGLFPKLVSFTKWIGKKIQGNLSEASPGPTYQIRQNYDATTEHVISDMNQMAAHSLSAGHQIEGAMTHAAQATDEALTHATRNPLAAFGKLQQAVMAIGGLGVGLSTLGNALQESNPAIAGTLTKLSEVVFAVDAVGGAFYALQQFGGNLFEFFADETVLSFLGAVKTKALATLPAIRAFGATLKAQFLSGVLLTNPIFLAIAGVVAAVTALYFAFKNNFLGIRDLVSSIAPLFQKVAEIVTGAITGISNAISALTSNLGVMLPQILLIGAVTISSMDSLPIKEILVSKMESAEKAIAPIAARISRKIQGDTHYTTLGVAPTANPQELKAAYRSKAKQLHPDLNQSKGAVSEFQRVTEAYKTLADAERRVAYDAAASTRAMGGFTNSVKRLPELLSSGVSGGMSLLRNFIKELPAIVDGAGRKSLELIKLLMGDAVGVIASNFPKLYKVIERIGQAILKKFNQLGTGVKKFIGFFLGPTDVAAFGMHRLGDAVSGLSPQVGKALHGLGDLTTWYGDFMGLHSMVYAGLKKFKLTQPLANLAKTIATSHPVLEKFARFSKGLADDGFEFLSQNYGDHFKKQLDKLTPALNSLKSKFSDFATSAISAFSTRWSSFVTAWPGMVDGAVKAIQPKFQGLTNFLTGVGSQMLTTGTSLTQPLLRASTTAAVQMGVLVPANQAISASYAETAIAANSSSLAIVKSSGTSAFAVATEAGEIIPLNFSIAGSFGALTTGITTATTAVWAFISPWVIAVSTALAPFLPVILGVVGAVALFGLIWKTNLFGLGAAIKPLLDFSVGLLKIVGAAIFVVSGLFLVVNAAKLVWMVLKNIFHGVSNTIQETQKTVAKSWFGEFLAKLIAPIKFVWNALITLSEAILGIGRGGQILNTILEDIAKHPVRLLQAGFGALQWLIESLIKPLLSLATSAWDLAIAFGQGVGGAISSLGGMFENTGAGIKGAWVSVVGFLQSTFERVINFLKSVDWNTVMTGVRDVLMGIGLAIAQPFIWVYNQIDAIAKKSTEVFDALGEKLSKIPVIGIAFQKGSTAPAATTPTTTTTAPSTVGAQFPLASASDQVQQAWTGFGSWFGNFMTTLPEDAQMAGQGLISALNCWPTIVIPQSWEKAAGQIGGTLVGLTQEATTQGGAIAQGMQDQIAPSITTIARKVALLRQGFNWRGVQMMLGEEGLTDQLAKLQGATVNFKKSFVNALLHLDFATAKQSLMDYGKAWLATGDGILGSLKNMTTSAIAFGIYSLISLNPLLFVMGGIALAGLAIAFNFLGIRTILGGLIGVIKGLIGFLVSTVQFVIQLGRAFRTITQGIFSLDFSMVQRGFMQAFGAIGLYVQRVRESLVQVLGGAIQVLQGLFEGLGQIGGTVLQVIGLRGGFIGDTFNRVINGALYLGSALMTLVTKPQIVWQKLKELLDAIWGKIGSITEKATAAAGQVSEAVKSSVVGRAVRAASKRMSGESPTLSDARAAVDFEERIKGKEPGLTVGDRAAQTQKGLGGFVGGLFKKRNQEVPTAAVASISTPEVAPDVPAAQTQSRRGILSRMKLRRQEAQEAVAAEKQMQDAVSRREAALSAAGRAIGSISAVASALAPQISGPIMLVGTLVNTFTSIPDAISDLKEAKAGFGEITSSIQSGILGISNRMKTAWADTLRWFTSLNLSQKAAGLLQNANDAIASSVSSLKSVIKNAWTSIVTSYNEGGNAAVIAKTIATANAFISNTFNSLASGAKLLWAELVAGYESGGILGAIQSVYQFVAAKLFASTTSAEATAVQAAVEVPANAAIAASEQAVAATAVEAGVAQVDAAIASSVAATTEAGVVGGANTFMSLTFGALAAAAGVAWAAITGPLLPIILAIGALVAVVGGIYLAFKTNFAGIGTLFSTFWNSITQLGSSVMTLFSPLMPLIKLIGGLFIGVLLSPILLIVGALTLVVQGINAVVQGVIAIASTAFKFLWNLIPQPLRWLLEQAAKGIGFAINALFGGDKGSQQETDDLPQFAVGGPVSASQPGGPVAAILHDNEFVMNPDATRENYGLLQLLNSGVSAEDAIRMIPTTPSELIMPSSGRGGAESSAGTTAETPKIELNITFTGNIVLGGNNSRENAREFINLIGPEIEELVVEAMRQRGEFSR